jgi:hypothetical protein
MPRTAARTIAFLHDHETADGLLEFQEMAASLKDDLLKAGFRGEILVEQALGPLTTWRIGGPAEILATPSTSTTCAAP